MRWILASASPRRRELLKQLGLPFEVLPSEADENIAKDTPEALVEELSRRKALDVAKRVREHSLVLGADTVVALGNTVLGKPGTPARAMEMLRLLSGKEHRVLTGVTLTESEEGRVIRQNSFVQSTRVFLYDLSDEEIQAYVQTGEPMDKAGAYGIQGGFARFVREIRGDYNNVVGLPAARVYQTMKEMLGEVLPFAECTEKQEEDR